MNIRIDLFSRQYEGFFQNSFTRLRALCTVGFPFANVSSLFTRAYWIRNFPSESKSTLGWLNFFGSRSDSKSSEFETNPMGSTLHPQLHSYSEGYSICSDKIVNNTDSSCYMENPALKLSLLYRLVNITHCWSTCHRDWASSFFFVEYKHRSEQKQRCEDYREMY